MKSQVGKFSFNLEGDTLTEDKLKEALKKAASEMDLLETYSTIEIKFTDKDGKENGILSIDCSEQSKTYRSLMDLNIAMDMNKMMDVVIGVEVDLNQFDKPFKIQGKGISVDPGLSGSVTVESVEQTLSAQAAPKVDPTVKAPKPLPKIPEKGRAKETAKAKVEGPKAIDEVKIAHITFTEQFEGELTKKQLADVLERFDRVYYQHITKQGSSVENVEITIKNADNNSTTYLIDKDTIKSLHEKITKNKLTGDDLESLGIKIQAMKSKDDTAVQPGGDFSAAFTELDMMLGKPALIRQSIMDLEKFEGELTKEYLANRLKAIVQAPIYYNLDQLDITMQRKDGVSITFSLNAKAISSIAGGYGIEDVSEHIQITKQQGAVLSQDVVDLQLGTIQYGKIVAKPQKEKDKSYAQTKDAAKAVEDSTPSIEQPKLKKQAVLNFDRFEGELTKDHLMDVLKKVISQHQHYEQLDITLHNKEGGHVTFRLNQFAISDLKKGEELKPYNYVNFQIIERHGVELAKDVNELGNKNVLKEVSKGLIVNESVTTPLDRAVLPLNIFNTLLGQQLEANNIKQPSDIDKQKIDKMNFTIIDQKGHKITFELDAKALKSIVGGQQGIESVTDHIKITEQKGIRLDDKFKKLNIENYDKKSKAAEFLDDVKHSVKDKYKDAKKAITDQFKSRG